MNAQELQRYIYDHIPIIAANHFMIERITTDQVFVRGSYREHINHRDSVFGGSISTIMTLAAWSRVRLIMEDIDPGAVIVIQNSHVDFLAPVLADFTAVNRVLDGDELSRLRASLERFGKGRVSVSVDVRDDNSETVLAQFRGDFVIVIKKED